MFNFFKGDFLESLSYFGIQNLILFQSKELFLLSKETVFKIYAKSYYSFLKIKSLGPRPTKNSSKRFPSRSYRYTVPFPWNPTASAT